MPDERMSDGEIRRSLERIDRRVDDLAKSAVPLDAWTRENLHLQEQIKDGDEDCKERTKQAMTAIEKLEKRSQLTVGRLLMILAILATLLAGWWAAYGAAKGVH